MPIVGLNTEFEVKHKRLGTNYLRACFETFAMSCFHQIGSKIVPFRFKNI